MASSQEDIEEVYNTDIMRMSKLVYNRKGLAPFLSGLSGYSKFTLYDGAAPSILGDDDAVDGIRRKGNG